MRFLTKAECEQWWGEQRDKPDAVPDAYREHIHPPSEPGQIFYLARWLADSLTFRQSALLWITDWGISTENWHLYYVLRHAYGDQRLLHEAPGHLFLDYETAELASFLQLAMLNGWGGYLLTEADYVNAFFDHDGFMEFYARSDVELEDIRRDIVSRWGAPHSGESKPSA